MPAINKYQGATVVAESLSLVQVEVDGHQFWMKRAEFEKAQRSKASARSTARKADVVEHAGRKPRIIGKRLADGRILRYDAA